MTGIYTPPVADNISLVISNVPYVPPTIVLCVDTPPVVVNTFTVGTDFTVPTTFTSGNDLNVGTLAAPPCVPFTIDLLPLTEPIPIVQNAFFLLV